MSPQWILDYLIKEWAVIKQAPVTFAAICLLAWVFTFLLNRLWFQEIIKRKDDLIADRDKKLAVLPAPSEHGADSRLLLQAQELALARKEKQEAIAALAGKRQQLKEVERERDRYKRELAEAKKQVESLQPHKGQQHDR